MVPRQQNAQLPLFLLLGLLGVVISLHAQLTPAQRFQIKHLNMAHRRCDDAMRVVNRYRRPCRTENTFLHTTFAAVARVCHTTNVTCPRSRETNCHRSPHPVPVTYCNLTRNAHDYRNCRYGQRSNRKIYIIACGNRLPQDDARYTLVPVHLDDII
ncbi:eosinophil cationic protein-like [Lagenorhynchus albirostris]|uniref:eosinophil cationic protein-like n=1 Tax=Lagenorhynchus albirostris TaxID=27610 RepID=UPI0028E4298C|nr:eosinophil cationic protein-like [Lagenorhynchus albirostris]XP_060024342.1 eosinophil cationic protein-like [Lagenorhynchus albirostris]